MQTIKVRCWDGTEKDVSEDRIRSCSIEAVAIDSDGTTQLHLKVGTPWKRIIVPAGSSLPPVVTELIANSQVGDEKKPDLVARIRELERELAQWKTAASACISCLEGDVSQVDTPEKLVQRLKKLHGWNPETDQFDEVRVQLDAGRVFITAKQIAESVAPSHLSNDDERFVWSVLAAALSRVASRQTLDGCQPYPLRP